MFYPYSTIEEIKGYSSVLDSIIYGMIVFYSVTFCDNFKLATILDYTAFS